MIRLTSFISLVLLSGSTIWAQVLQNSDVHWSGTYRNGETKVDYIASLDSSYVMTYGNLFKLLGKSKNFYARYDRQTLTKIWQVEEVIDRYAGALIEFHSMVTVGSTTYVFYRVDSKVDNFHYVLMRTIDRDGNLSDFKELMKISYELYTMGNFRISWNRDLSSFAFVSFLVVDGNENLHIEVKRFDRDGAPIGGSSVQMVNAKGRVFLADADYALSGDVFVLAQRRPEQLKDEKAEIFAPNNEFFILHAKPNEEVIQEVALGLKDKYVVGGIDVETDQGAGKVAVSGMYSVMRFGPKTGLFHLTLDQKTLELATSDYKSFSDFEYLNDGRRDGTTIERHKTLINETYEFRGMLPREGGGSMVMIEDYYLEVLRWVRKGVSTDIPIYHFANITAMLVDAEGVIESISVIPKHQYSVGDDGYVSGFLVARDGENFNFLFNDAKGNETRWLEHQAPRTMDEASNAILTQVTLRPDGSLNYVPLVDTRKGGLFLVPKRGKSHIGLPGEAVIPGGKRGKLIFMHLRPEPN